MTRALTDSGLAQKRSRLRKLRGETAYVPAAKARTHIASLRAAGWSIRSIAGESGVPATTVSLIARGEQPTARPELVLSILALHPETLATKSDGTDDPFVSRVGTVRRLQALMVMGWPGAEVTRRLNALGVTDKRAAYNLLHQPGQWVLRSRHDAVAAVYHKLSHRAGPSERTRKSALSRGYASPGRWDDIDRDEAPDKAPELCAEDGCLNQAGWLVGRATDAAICVKHAQAAAEAA